MPSLDRALSSVFVFEHQIQIKEPLNASAGSRRGGLASLHPEFSKRSARACMNLRESP